MEKALQTALQTSPSMDMSVNPKEAISDTVPTSPINSGQTNVRNETDVVAVPVATANTDALQDITKEDFLRNSDLIVSDRVVTDCEAKNDINDNRVGVVLQKEEEEKEEKVSLQLSTETVTSSSDDAATPRNVCPLPIPTVRIKLGGSKEKKAVYKLVISKSEKEEDGDDTDIAEPVNGDETDLNRNEDCGIEASPIANGSLEMELDTNRERFEVTPSSSSDSPDLTTEEGRRTYVIHCIDALASKRQKLTAQIKKKLTPFQYFCKHVDRPLLYSIFGNTIDGYSCPLCQHYHRLLPAFLFHMRTHKDTDTLLELYVNIGGKLTNLDCAISRIRNNSPRRRARRVGPKFTRRKRRERNVTNNSKVEVDCPMPALERQDLIEVTEPPIDEVVKLVPSAVVPAVKVKGQVATAVISFEEWTKNGSSYPRPPDLPHLDITDNRSLKTFIDVVCDHIAELRLKFMAYRKNMTPFEVLCNYLERSVLYDIFEREEDGFRCPCCRHCSEKLKYMMSHARGHRDLSFILELYLKRGGEFDFMIKEQPRRRRSTPVVKSEVPSAPLTNRKRAPSKVATGKAQIKGSSTDAFEEKELDAVSNSVSVKIVTAKAVPRRRRRPPSKLIAEEEAVPHCEELDSEVPICNLDPDTSESKAKTSRKSRDVGILERTRRTDGFCAKALSPKTFNMLRGIVSRKITKVNPHYCLFCGKPFQSGSGLYIHYYQHEIKDNVTKNRNGIVPSKEEPSSSVVVRRLSEGSSSEDSNRPLVYRKKKKTENATASKKHVDSLAVRNTTKKRRMYSTKSSRAKSLYMFNGILTEKITRENPHFCKFCGHPFHSGQGVYKHYLLHTKAATKKTMDGTEVTPRSPRVPIKESGSASSNVYDTTANEKSTQLSTSPRSKRNTSDVNNANMKLNQKERSGSEVVHEENDTAKEISNPSKDLDPETVHMLKEILKNKITVDNPHYCHECGYRFNSGCGLYNHYYVHFTQEKDRRKQTVFVTEEPTASTSQHVVMESVATTSNGATVMGTNTTTTTATVPVVASNTKRRNQGNSPKPKKCVPTVYLDAKTYLLLRRIAKETTAENPHLCMICNHPFHDGRGIYAHYNRHARQNTNPTAAIVSKRKEIPTAEISKKVQTTTNVKPIKTGEPKRKPTNKLMMPTTNTERNELQNKFCPMKALNKTTLTMLRGVIKKKITPENPHHCTYCSKLFFSGTGLYFHYLKHWKLTDVPVVIEDTGPSSSAVAIDMPKMMQPQHRRGIATTSHSKDVNDFGLKEEEEEEDEQELVLCELEHKTKTLLYCLTRDALVLKDLGWPHRDAVDVVADILNICNVVPFDHCGKTISEKLHCLRNNVHRLIRFCISDDAMTEHGWSYKLVDDAVKEIIASDENFSIF